MFTVPINIFKHQIIDGIVHPDDQLVLDKYVISRATSASPVKDSNGHKRWPLHTVTLDDGSKVLAFWRGMVDLENHTEKNLIKQTTSNSNVRYYMMTDSTDESAIVKMVNGYVQHVTSNIEKHIQEERYKFDALRQFQETFDIAADDLAKNLKIALSKIDNLAVGVGYYPVASMYDIAQSQPNEVRRSLQILFSDELTEYERIRQFQDTMIPLSREYSRKNTSHPYNIDLRFMSLLLSLRRPDEYMYFKPTEIDKIYSELYGEKTGTQGADIHRILKARDLGREILHELERHSEFAMIRNAMGVSEQSNLWFAQDVIWWAAHHRQAEDDLSGLEARIRTFLEQNPDFLNEVELSKGQIDVAVTEFQQKFSPARLQEMSDEQIEHLVIYNQSSTKDGLSYVLEHSPVIGHMGGIRGGSAGKMGYYQGRDGQWKKFQSNEPTTRDDVLSHRRVDIEVLSRANEFIQQMDFDGLAAYQKSLSDAASKASNNGASIADSTERYKAVLLGLVWVRKYFAIVHPDSFIQIYSNAFVEKLEEIADIGDINGDTSQGDYSLWYRKMNHIASLAAKFNISVYELSRVLWKIINQESGEVLEEDVMNDDEITAVSLNTIVYGPPGTGKTYSVHRYKNQLLSNQQSKFEHLISGSVKDTLLFIFAQQHNVAQNPFDMWRSEDFQRLQEFNGRTKSNGSAVRNEMAYDSTMFERIEDGGIKYRATQEGLEYIQSVIEAQADEPATTIDDFYQFITFHQSYGYEEFIEGIRAETSDTGAIRYVVRDGVFKSFCRRAESDPDNNYLFVIDEINRANISKVFGELITLLESSKRLGASEGLTTTLPYSGEKFGIPKNLYVLGTMNTADRSIALLDIALRRRFDFIEIMPQPELLSTDVEGVNLQKLLTAVNTKVTEEIDRNHQIGHSYLMHINTLQDLRMAWYQKIIPLLQEYFYDDSDDLQAILKSFVDGDEVVLLYSEAFKQALMSVYEETQDTTSGIQL